MSEISSILAQLFCSAQMPGRIFFVSYKFLRQLRRFPFHDVSSSSEESVSSYLDPCP